MKQADGLITSIYDKELGRELLNAPANDLRCTSGDRYRRYGYLAFPFDVPGGTFYAQLNGPVMRPYLDLTGHTGDAYVGARDWVGVENGEFGVALVQFDSMLVEFGEIHPDKTCYTGKPPAGNSAIFPALFNDWLVEHKPDGESFKYTGLITASKAIHGERLGQLYLEWGLDPSPDFDHWELYRGETADFPCDAAHFVAKGRTAANAEVVEVIAKPLSSGAGETPPPHELEFDLNR